MTDAMRRPLEVGDVVTVKLNRGGPKRGKVVRVGRSRYDVRLFPDGPTIERRAGEVVRD